MIWPLHLIFMFAVIENAPAPGRTEPSTTITPESPVAHRTATGCLPVRGDTITAGDLATVNAAFAALDPHLAMSLAPMPGARRFFPGTEFVRLARQYRLTLGAVRDVCFEWPMQVPDQQKMAAAMAQVLKLEQPAIQIVEQSQFPAPSGEFVFPRENLTAVSGSKGALWMWRGFVRYASNQKFQIWAKLRIVAPSERVVAVTALLPGEPIVASQLKTVATFDGFAGGIYASSVDEVVGLAPMSRIEASEPLRLAQLKVPPDIVAGALVQVEVRNGPLRIYSVGQAVRSGRAGETIPLINPGSSAHFNARVEGKDRVSVTVQAK